MKLLTALPLLGLVFLGACSFEAVNRNDPGVNCTNAQYSTVCHKLRPGEAAKPKTNLSGY